MKINKITWFAKQLQHKTNTDTLKLSLAGEGYVLSMEELFALEFYATGKPVPCPVLQEANTLYSANIEQGLHYKLQVNGQIVLFRIMTRKIWFFDSVAAMIAGT